MPIDVRCPKCKKAYRVGDTLAGKKARCKACGGIIPVPAAAEDDEILDVIVVEEADAPAPKRVSSLRRKPVDEEEEVLDDAPVARNRTRERRNTEVDDEIFEDDLPDQKKRTPTGIGSLLSGMTTPKEPDPAFEKWRTVIGCFLVGVIATAGTISFYRDITSLEAGQVGSVRVHKLTGLVYDIGGKWGVTLTGSCLAMGFYGLALFAMTWEVPNRPRKKKKKRPKTAADD